MLQSKTRAWVSIDRNAILHNVEEIKKLLDEDTAACFSDFLNGYIRRADRLIAIPINESESNE